MTPRKEIVKLLSNPPRPLRFRFSLRTLLFAIGFISVACVALKFAGPIWWSILAGVALLVFMGVAVLAFIGHAEIRARAIGFTVCVAIYGGLLYLSPSEELDPHKGLLPTTKGILVAYQAISTGKYMDMATGKEVPKDKLPSSGGFGGFGGGGMSMITYSETPDRKQFTAIGHLLWAALFGWLGWSLAGYVVRSKTAGHPE